MMTACTVCQASRSKRQFFAFCAIQFYVKGPMGVQLTLGSDMGWAMQLWTYKYQYLLISLVS